MTRRRARATYSSTAAAGSALRPTFGFVPRDAAELLRGCEMVVLGSNHDPHMLQAGPYPYSLKMRVAGPSGHLSNPDCAVFAADLVKSGTRTLVLAHLSEKNNMPELARQQTLSALRGLPACEVLVAPKEHMEHPVSFGEENYALCPADLRRKARRKILGGRCQRNIPKRLGAYCKLEIIELPEQRLPRTPSEGEIAQALEGSRAHREQAAARRVCDCDVSKASRCPLSSWRTISEKLTVSGTSKICVLIGGSCGLSERVKRRRRCGCPCHR